MKGQLGEETNLEKKEWISARNVLWYLVFIGFAVNYMLRTNLNIAIVSMVKPRPHNNLTFSSECIVKVQPNNSTTTAPQQIPNGTMINIVNQFHQSNGSESTPHILLTTLIPTVSEIPLDDSSELFDWDEKQQSNVLGAFFWLHWVTQIPGGILASKYGTKLVFGLANFTGVLVCFFIPMSAYMGHTYLIMLRCLQGLLTGFAWPAMHNMTARWIPPNERSKFVTAYLGSSVGAALTYPLCGFIIDKWGWEYSFHACGVLGTLWYLGWWMLVYDSPAKHPRISEKEKRYILDSIGEAFAKKKAPVPWRKILTSRAVWMNVLAQWGGVWGLFTLMTHAPTYFKFIHGWNIRATGLLSGMPHLLRMVWAYLFSQTGDYLLRSNKMSRTNVRKLATASCTIAQGIFTLALAYSGCNYLAAIVFLSASIAVHGAVSTGPLACAVDISPNYASIVLGIINTLVCTVGFITPAVVGYLTYNNQTVPQWQKVFWISTFMLMSTGIAYTLFAKSELKSWNSPDLVNGKKETELVTLKVRFDENDAEDGQLEREKVGKNGYVPAPTESK